MLAPTLGWSNSVEMNIAQVTIISPNTYTSRNLQTEIVLLSRVYHHHWIVDTHNPRPCNARAYLRLVEQTRISHP